MKRAAFFILAITLLASLALPAPVQAQTSVKQTWTSIIYYYNPGEKTEITVTYFSTITGLQAGQSTPIDVDTHGSGEIYIGETNVPDGFKGSAVLMADTEIQAIYEQSPSADPNYSRMLYSAFSQDQGASTIYIPAVVNDPKGFISQVGIQNVMNTATSLTLRFYDAKGIQIGSDVVTSDINTNYSYIFQANAVFLQGTAEQFVLPKISSLVITANADGARVVAAVEDLHNVGRRAYAFEGISDPSSIFFMPLVKCSYNHGSQKTSFELQNVSGETNTVTFTGYTENNTSTSTTPKKTSTSSYKITLAPYGRATVSACSIRSSSRKSFSAIIEGQQQIAVVAKNTGSDGVSTAYTGQIQGATEVSLPYLVWSANTTKGYQATISVMNTSATAASNVKVTFYRNDGVNIEYKLPTLGPYSKRTFNIGTAKAYRPTDKTFRGAAVVESDGTAALLVHVYMERKVSGVKGTTYLAEDYIGVPTP